MVDIQAAPAEGAVTVRDVLQRRLALIAQGPAVVTALVESGHWASSS